MRIITFMGKTIKKVASIALPIAVTAITGNPALGAVASGGLTKAQGGSWGDAFLNAGGSYLGGKIGANIGSSTAGRALGLGGNIGSALGTTSSNAVGPAFMDIGLGNIIGESASNSLGAAIANTSVGGALGSYAGSSLGQPKPKQAGNAGPSPFSPRQEAAMSLPGSLSGFAGLAPDQVSSNIANQGVYGGGNGPEEQNYYLNLVNRRLVDESGRTDSDLNDISNPIERSYLSQLGLGGHNDPRSLLEAISRMRAAA